MAHFTSDQAAAILAIQQVINEWGDELDQREGLGFPDAPILTDACRYNVGGEWREGREAVIAFYRNRKAGLDAAGGGPTMRHVISNFRVSFTAPDHAEVGFLLVFFAATGSPPFLTGTDPLAVADVRMECRADGAGDWRISLFDSAQIFRRPPAG